MHDTGQRRRICAASRPAGAPPPVRPLVCLGSLPVAGAFACLVGCSMVLDSGEIQLVQPEPGGAEAAGDGGARDAGDVPDAEIAKPVDAARGDEPRHDAGGAPDAEVAESEAAAQGDKLDAAMDAGADAGDSDARVPVPPPPVANPGGDAGADAAPADATTLEDCPAGLQGARCDQWKFIDVVAGSAHACGLLEGGRVLCWGNDDSQQLAEAPTGSGFVEIHSGAAYSCAIREDRTIRCWGQTSYGLLDVPLDPVLSLVTGWDAACIEAEPGIYTCWGNDAYGKHSGRPAQPVQDMAIGWEQGCALHLDGSLECWGEDHIGQATPPAGNDFVALALGTWHSCAQHMDGILECWGAVTNAPAQAVRSMSSRGKSTCAVLLDDSVRCWGIGGAIDPPAGIRAQKVAVGDGHSCALLKDASITCWGQNTYGALSVPAVP